MEKELKRLNRSELIDIIYELKQSEQRLQYDISHLKIQLEHKEMQFENVGSVAEAAFAITEIFAAAQKTADIYLEEVNSRKENLDSECEAIRAKAEAEAESIIKTAEKEAEKLIQEAIKNREFIMEQCRKSREELKKFRAIIQNLDGEDPFCFE
ncbi:MAG: hypothetical protein IKY41_05475 [Clostridia bacterium]|nr:hypothetical protein [Clostridia bacterium]